MTTTLLVSPLKSQEQLKRVGDAFHQKHGVEFIAVDYRADGGTQDQSRVTKEEQLYRQDYCGCIFGLTMQREQQDKLMDEMFSPISAAILPASIEERLELYEKRIKLEEKNIPYKIIRQKFLNYRQFFARLIQGKKKVIPAYVLNYSILPRKKAQGRIDFVHQNIHYFNREEIRFITLKTFNQLSKQNYQNLYRLIFHPPSLEIEQNIRHHICSGAHDISPVVVVSEIPDGKLTLELDAKVYEDTREYILSKDVTYLQ